MPACQVGRVPREQLAATARGRLSLSFDNRTPLSGGCPALRLLPAVADLTSMF